MSADKLTITFHPSVLESVLGQIRSIQIQLQQRQSPEWADIEDRVQRRSGGGVSSLIEIEQPNRAELGMEPGGLSTLLVMLDELGRNTTRAFIPLKKTDISDKRIGDLVKIGLVTAKEQGVDPTLRFGVEFDDQTGVGRMWTEQPMLSGYHGLFVPNEAISARSAEIETRPSDGGGGSAGGLASIESGILFCRLENNGFTKDGLEVSIIKTEEERRLWVGFTFRRIEEE